MIFQWGVNYKAWLRLLRAQLVVVAALALSSMPVFSSSTKPRAVLEIIKPTDASFDSLVEQHFPGLVEMESYPTFRTTLVILRNIGDETANAYALQWTITPSRLPAYTISSRYVNRYIEPRTLNVSIEPGAVRLLSTMFNLGEARYEDANSFVLEYGPTLMKQAIANVAVAASLDGVVSGNRHFEGANATKIYEQYTCSRNADHDEVLYLDKTLPSNVSMEDIRSQLDKDMQRSVSEASRSTGIQTIYLLAKAQADDGLGAILERRGASAFLRMLNRMSSEMTLQDYSSMAIWK